MGSGVGSSVVLRELDSQELGQGAERIVLEIMMMTMRVFFRESKEFSLKTGTLHLLFLGFIFFQFVHLLGDQLHLHRVLLPNFEVESSHTELEN